MASSRNVLSDNLPVQIEEMPDRSDEMSIVTQGPVKRVALWKEIIDDPEVNGSVQGHYFKDSGLLLLDLHSGEVEE